MAFSDTQGEFSQEHFTIIELDVPIVEGECTLGGLGGYGTPLTCEQPSNAVKTYRFTSKSSPLLNQSDIFRCVESITESPTELQSGRGLASRGSLSIRFNDFIGDPNPLAPAVTQQVSNQGTFFGKLQARNVLEKRSIRIINYRSINGQLPNLSTDGEQRHYIVKTLKDDGKGKWTITADDELSRANINEQLWPVPQDGYLRIATGLSNTTIFVDPNVNYQANDVVRIGQELMIVTAVRDIGTSTAEFDVPLPRTGIISTPFFSQLISRSEPSLHNEGDEVFVCKAYDDANIADVLEEILVDIGIDAAYIPKQDWLDEVNFWQPNATITALYYEAVDVNKVLSEILTSYMLDMWFDPVERLIKISAISVWQQSAATLSEGSEIDFNSIKKTTNESLRATNAFIVYDKPWKTRDDSVENYNRASLYSDPRLSTDDYYGEAKQKRFPNNPVIDEVAANTLVNRYVLRYGITPESYTWKTQERKLNFKTGDVVDLNTSAKVGFDGLPDSGTRAQIISIKPNYNKVGRDYTVKALTYEPVFGDGASPTEIVVSSDFNELNIYNNLAGQPPTAVQITVIIDGAKGSSTSVNNPALRIGQFAAGSKITLILANGASLQGRGGKGGLGGSANWDFESETYFVTSPSNGENGGICFDADGIDCDIYFSGATSNSNYPAADGFIRAPAGGGGAGLPDVSSQPPIGGNGGGGGAGDNPGNGGGGGTVIDRFFNDYTGIAGASGNTSGNGGSATTPAASGGGWGEDGQSADSSGGLAGKGVIDSGATVVFYGDTAERYINGNGDH